jgi:hypothetical protein
MPASARRKAVSSSSSCRRDLQVDEPNRDEEMTAVNTKKKRKESPGSGSTRSAAVATVGTASVSTSSRGNHHGEQMNQSTSSARGVESPRHSVGDAASARSFSSSSSRSHRSSCQERNGRRSESSRATPGSHPHFFSPPPYNKVRHLQPFSTIDSLLFFIRRSMALCWKQIVPSTWYHNGCGYRYYPS